MATSCTRPPESPGDMSIVSQLELLPQQAAALVYGPFITRKEAASRGLMFYYVGYECKNGHFAVHRVSGGCFECQRMRYGYKGTNSLHGPRKAPPKERPSQPLGYGPFISRQQALDQGLRHYYSGQPCPRGHYAPRFIGCCKCSECGRLHAAGTMRRWYQENREVARSRAKARYEENGDAIRAQARERRKRNPRIREQERTWNRRRRESLDVRILGALRNRLCDAIRGKNKSARTQELLGCSIEALKAHLEGQFLPGMSWDNWAHKGWHIDHIRPCASFDLTDPEQQRQCFHYTNLQPLWAADNIRKGAKFASP